METIVEESVLTWNETDRVKVAIARLRQFEPPEGYFLAFSGGKDSQCVYHLAVEAGVKFDAHFNVSLEPPELMRFIRLNYPDVKWEKHQGFNFYTKMSEKGFPLRQARWCCELMKEWGGSGRIVLTGVRWEESSGRRKRRLVDHLAKSRTVPEPKVCVNPIIDWEVGDVWSYLRSRNIEHCSLYDTGFKRLGCVLCPMATATEKRLQSLFWPKVSDAWLASFQRLYDRRVAEGNDSVKRWNSAKAMFYWYINEPDSIPKEQYCFAFE
jgi:phosphoadenosine phosphosulfate reductase